MLLSLFFFFFEICGRIGNSKLRKESYGHEKVGSIDKNDGDAYPCGFAFSSHSGIVAGSTLQVLEERRFPKENLRDFVGTRRS